MTSTCLIAIPVFNEAATLPAILGDLKRFQADHPRDCVGDMRFLFINDGSSDQSSEIIRYARRDFAGLEYIDKSINEGYGASLISAFHYAHWMRYDYLITMDCDGQHLVDDLLRFLRAAPDIDVVSGSRYLPDSEAVGYAPPDRQRINGEITDMLNARAGLGVTDAFCGFKRYRLAQFPVGLFQCRGYAFPMEVWAYIAARGLSVVELSVGRIYLTNDRSFGEALNNPTERKKYYLETWERALRRHSRPESAANL